MDRRLQRLEIAIGDIPYDERFGTLIFVSKQIANCRDVSPGNVRLDCLHRVGNRSARFDTISSPHSIARCRASLR